MHGETDRSGDAREDGGEGTGTGPVDPAAGAPLLHRAIVEETSSVLRHDVRNKLATIRNAVFFLKKKVGASSDDPKVAQFFGLVEKELAAAEGILTERTRAGGLLPSRRTTGRVGEVVDAAARAAAAAGASVEWSISDTTALAIDAEELRLAFECLLDNARDALPAAGGTIRVDCTEDGGGVLVRVRDAGSGIPEPVRTRGGIAFEHAREGHLGLGLAIARRLFGRSAGSLTLAADGVEVRFRPPEPRS